MADKPVEDTTTGDETQKLNYDLLPDNTVTVIVKVKGKVYASGAQTLPIDSDTPEEDMDSTLRAINGLFKSTLRTLFYTLGGRDKEEELPEEL